MISQPDGRPPADADPAPTRETVLVVENEELVREVICDVLKLNGYRVLAAGDGDEAVQAVEVHRGPIALLIMDVILPGAAGHVIAAWLEARRPGLRTLYVSGYSNDLVRTVEGRPFLKKPFTLDALAHKVREVLDAPE